MNETRIRIGNLRDDATRIIDSGRTDHDKCLVDPDDLTTLLDVVEAARRLVAATDPYGLDMEYTPFEAHTEFAAAVFAAKELLARFDFGAAE